MDPTMGFATAAASQGTYPGPAQPRAGATQEQDADSKDEYVADVNALKVHSVRRSNKDHSPGRGWRAGNKVGRGELQIHPQAKKRERGGGVLQETFCNDNIEDGQAAVQANFKEQAVMYSTAEVGDRVREFERGKKALTEHALDVSTKNHSPERRRRAEKEVGQGELQMNFKSHLPFAGVEGWATKTESGKKQARLRTKQQQEARFWTTEKTSIKKGVVRVSEEPPVGTPKAFTLFNRLLNARTS